MEKNIKASLTIKDAQRMDFAKSISKDQYSKVLETEIALQENKTEKICERLQLQNQSDPTEVQKVYDMIRPVTKNEGNVNSGKGDATEKISEETNSNRIQRFIMVMKKFRGRNCSHSYLEKDNFSQRETRISSINI